MKIAILDAGTLGSDVSLKEFSSFGEVAVYEKTAPCEMDARVEHADVLVLNKIRCNADTLKNAKCLRLICVAATGYDNIDLEYCRAHGIAVCNVVGYSTESVAQLTLSLVLALSTNLHVFHAYVADGSYTRSGAANKVAPVFHELAGKTWGIFGYGNIGKKVARVAEAIGCRVIVCKRHMTKEEYPVVDLDTLCRESDIITVHTPLNDGTRGAINAARLAMMKKDTVLVNVARGAVTDEKAVTDAILCGNLGGFGCDVYTEEPFSEKHPYGRILNHPNVILTPHMAWGSHEARSLCIAEMCKNIRAFSNGEVRNRVDLM
jgi:glycerate dehydrogenase